MDENTKVRVTDTSKKESTRVRTSEQAARNREESSSAKTEADKEREYVERDRNPSRQSEESTIIRRQNYKNVTSDGGDDNNLIITRNQPYTDPASALYAMTDDAKGQPVEESSTAVSISRGPSTAGASRIDNKRATRSSLSVRTGNEKEDEFITRKGQESQRKEQKNAHIKYEGIERANTNAGGNKNAASLSGDTKAPDYDLITDPNSLGISSDRRAKAGKYDLITNRTSKKDKISGGIEDEGILTESGPESGSLADKYAKKAGVGNPLEKKLKESLPEEKLLSKAKTKNINAGIDDFLSVQAKRKKIKARAVTGRTFGIRKYTMPGKSMKFAFSGNTGKAAEPASGAALSKIAEKGKEKITSNVIMVIIILAIAGGNLVNMVATSSENLQAYIPAQGYAQAVIKTETNGERTKETVTSTTIGYATVKQRLEQYRNKIVSGQADSRKNKYAMSDRNTLRGFKINSVTINGTETSIRDFQNGVKNFTMTTEYTGTYYRRVLVYPEPEPKEETPDTSGTEGGESAESTVSEPVEPIVEIHPETYTCTGTLGMSGVSISMEYIDPDGGTGFKYNKALSDEYSLPYDEDAFAQSILSLACSLNYGKELSVQGFTKLVSDIFDESFLKSRGCDIEVTIKDDGMFTRELEEGTFVAQGKSMSAKVKFYANSDIYSILADTAGYNIDNTTLLRATRYRSLDNTSFKILFSIKDTQTRRIAALGAMPYYCQHEEPWASLPYNGATLYSEGCGATSLAMIIAAELGDASITPETIVRTIAEYGITNTVNGFEAFYLVPELLGVSGVERVGANLDYIEEKLAQGCPMIVNIGPGGNYLHIHTNGGHFFVLYGLGPNGVLVYDPAANGVYNTSMANGGVPLSDIFFDTGHVQGVWIYPPIVQSNANNSNAERIFKYLRSSGWSKAAAAAAVGNFYQEAGNGGTTDIDPAAFSSYRESDGDLIESAGFAQFTDTNGKGLYSGLQAFAASRGKKWEDIEVQCDYLIYTMQNGGWCGKSNTPTYKGMMEHGYYVPHLSYGEFITTDDVEEATKAFLCFYENCGYDVAHYEDVRLPKALDAYQTWN